jgi:hypothetical protein
MQSHACLYDEFTANVAHGRYRILLPSLSFNQPKKTEMIFTSDATMGNIFHVLDAEEINECLLVEWLVGS